MGAYKYAARILDQRKALYDEAYMLHDKSFETHVQDYAHVTCMLYYLKATAGVEIAPKQTRSAISSGPNE